MEENWKKLAEQDLQEEINENTRRVQFMSFVTGIRGDSEFQVQTNVQPTRVSDYIEACVGIELNVILTLLKSNSVDAITTFLQLKEILLADSIKNIGANLQHTNLTEEEYNILRDVFRLNEIEAAIETKKVLSNLTNTESKEEDKEESPITAEDLLNNTTKKEAE